MIDILKIDRAEILCALYNAAKPQGLGFLHYTPEDMTIEHARELLSKATYFDYVYGRVIKVDLSGSTFDPRLYDRDNGSGAALKALEKLL